jgi:hypothetical protein
MTEWDRAPAGVERQSAARGWSFREEAPGVVILAAALGLWVLVLAGIAAPLGDGLARLRGRAPEAAAPACPVPAGAIASAAPAAGGQACR